MSGKERGREEGEMRRGREGRGRRRGKEKRRREREGGERRRGKGKRRREREGEGEETENRRREKEMERNQGGFNKKFLHIFCCLFTDLSLNFSPKREFINCKDFCQIMP